MASSWSKIAIFTLISRKIAMIFFLSFILPIQFSPLFVLIFMSHTSLLRYLVVRKEPRHTTGNTENKVA